MVTIHLSGTVIEILSLEEGHDIDLLGSRDVIIHVTIPLPIWGFLLGHVTIKLRMCDFLLVVHCNYTSILQRYGNMESQTFWGHDVDLLQSSDVIGHVTIRLPIWGFP